MSNADQILQLATAYESDCLCIVKTAKIRKLPNGKYRVVSLKGKNLGTYDSRSKAVERLKQVEFFKHRDAGAADDLDDSIDLMGAIDFSFSAIMREMRKNATKEAVREFLTMFKKEFDAAVKKGLQKPEKVALQNSLIKFDKVHKIKLEKKLVKNAAISELGSAQQVGSYLANIVKFTLSRLKPESRPKALNSLRNKFFAFNANDIAQKKLPASAAIGQSLSFVKNVLFNHDANYVREVLNYLVKSL